MLDLRERSGLAIILISHDLAVVAQTCDSVAVMYAGRIVERAAKSDLVRHPLHPYTAGLIGSQPGSAPPLEELPSITGQPPSLTDLPSGCRFHPRCPHAEAACYNEIPALTAVAAGRASACLNWRLLQEAT